MKYCLAALLTLIPLPVSAQTISPVDLDVAEQFRRALVAGDDVAINNLLSENVSVMVVQQMGPNGPNREVPEGKGKQVALDQYHAVVAATGQPTDAQCGSPSPVSVFCQYRFDQPGRGMTSMIMFDGKKIGALMIKYGGAAIK